MAVFKEKFGVDKGGEIYHVSLKKKHAMAKKMEHDMSPKTQNKNYKSFKKKYHYED